MQRLTPLLVLLLVCGGDLRDARAGLIFHRERRESARRPRHFEHTFERAGNPLAISPHAQPAVTPAYVGYYVGGGTAFGGEPRRVEDGTWGLDYAGYHIPRFPRLAWSHGRRFQGGGGTYQTEGTTPHEPRDR